jgi:hypothetical protein
MFVDQPEDLLEKNLSCTWRVQRQRLKKIEKMVVQLDF